MRQKKSVGSHYYTARLSLCGVMIAVAVVLDVFLKVPVNLFGSYALKLSFGMVPVLFVSVRYGPVYGGICGGLMDLLQAIIAPIGAYNPLFTVSAFAAGFIPGLFFVRTESRGKLRLLAAVGCGQGVSSVLLSSLFLHLSYGLPLWGLMPIRAVTQALLVPIYLVLLILLFRVEGYARRSSAPAA